MVFLARTRAQSKTVPVLVPVFVLEFEFGRARIW